MTNFALALISRKTYRWLKSGSFHSQPYLAYREHLAKSEPIGERALLNLTVDLELGWSRARRGQGVTSLAESLRRARLAREAFPEFLSLAESYRIPITFATVAHLAVSDCAQHRAPPVFKPYWCGDDWFAIDPRSSLSESPDYYGADILDKVLASRVGHEIASHTFSHVDLADDATTPEVAQFEIIESRLLLKQLDKNLTTFVFPNNTPAFLTELAANGFTVYRTESNHLLKKDGFDLWQFPVGLWLSPHSFSADEIIALLLIAARRKCLINFFCHLYEFATRRQLRNFFQPIFALVNRAREQGYLEAQTMRVIVKMAAESKVL